MKNQYNRAKLCPQAKAGEHSDRTTNGAGMSDRRAVAARLDQGGARRVSVMMALAPAAHAQQQHRVRQPGAYRDACAVTVGKTQDVRTDQSFADITVGDPDVADVSPLTDHSLSILGKKIGTTRVTVYDADKKPVGIFDIEVSYDISRLAARSRISPAAASRCRRSTAASCCPAPRRTPSRSTRRWRSRASSARIRSTPSRSCSRSRSSWKSASSKSTAMPAAISACNGTRSAIRCWPIPAPGCRRRKLPITHAGRLVPAAG